MHGGAIRSVLMTWSSLCRARLWLAVRALALMSVLFLVAGCTPADLTPPQALPTTSSAAKPTTGAAAASPAVTASPSPAVAASPSPAVAASPSPAASAPAQPTAVPRTGAERDLILATTTSTQDSGLLDVLIPLFQQQTGYTVKTVSVGTGAALALGARGEADVVLVHAPASEVDWMNQGNGTERLLVMHNDFLLVGPPSDPAHIKGDSDAVTAMKKIADARAPFVSRGDNSGTNQLELQLWPKASVDQQGQPWYIVSGTGMGQTLIIADQRQAYTISDRATWLAFNDRVELPIMVEGDPGLLNVYHVMPVNPAKFPNVPINTAGGKAFADFMVAPETQRVIGDFGKDKFGQPLFAPDAGKSESDVGL